MDESEWKRVVRVVREDGHAKTVVLAWAFLSSILDFQFGKNWGEGD